MVVSVIIAERIQSNIQKIQDACKADPKISILSTTTKGLEAISLTTRLQPKVLIITTALSDISIIELVKRIMGQKPTPVLILHTAKDPLPKEIADFDVGMIDSIKVPIINNNYSLMETSLTIRIHILSKLKIKKFDRQIAELSTGIQARFNRVKELYTQTKEIIIKPKTENQVTEAIEEKEILEFNQITKDRETLTPITYSGAGRLNKIVIIGSSTGGPRLLADLIPKFPINLPPVLVIQHMPEGFIGSFAQRLDRLSKVKVSEAKQGEQLSSGSVYVAPGGFHLELSQSVTGGNPRITLVDGELVNYVKPAVDVTLVSASKIYGSGVISVILTGMGSDGREGSRIVKSKKGKVLALHKKDSDIYGMNKSVIDAGLSDAVLTKNELVYGIIRAIEGKV